MKTIFITSFHVLVSRNILLAPFLKMLTDAGYRVVLIMPKKKEEYFKETFKHPQVIIEAIENKLGRVDDVFKDLGLAAIRSASLRIMRHRRMGIERPLSQRLMFWAPPFRSLIPKLFRLFMDKHSFHALFEKYKPEVVFSTDVFSSNDCRLLFEAQVHGVRTIGMVRSWDNLTTKGGFRVVPDVLVVQNQVAKEDAITFHGIDEGIIKLIGIPHYDNYTKAPDVSRDDVAKKLGIPLGKNYFVYAPLGDRIMKVGDIVHKHGYDNEMVKLIDERLPADTYLVVRFPPTDTVTIDRTRLSSRVVYSAPGVRFGEGVKGVRASEMNKDDDESLFHTLYYSSGVINPFSSLCVDAVFLDRPVIVPAFDPLEVGYWESVSRLQEFDHFVPIMKSTGVKVAKNPDQLKVALEIYAKDQSVDSTGRKALSDLECLSRDGRSSERLLSVIRGV
jgi:hypothetical protein